MQIDSHPSYSERAHDSSDVYNETHYDQSFTTTENRFIVLLVSGVMAREVEEKLLSPINFWLLENCRKIFLSTFFTQKCKIVGVKSLHFGYI